MRWQKGEDKMKYGERGGRECQSGRQKESHTMQHNKKSMLKIKSFANKLHFQTLKKKQINENVDCRYSNPTWTAKHGCECKATEVLKGNIFSGLCVEKQIEKINVQAVNSQLLCTQGCQRPSRQLHNTYRNTRHSKKQAFTSLLVWEMSDTTLGSCFTKQFSAHVLVKALTRALPRSRPSALPAH